MIKTIFLLIFVFLLSVPIDATGIDYNYNKTPMYEFNGTPLIESINGSYNTPIRIMGGKIHDIKNEDIELDYFLRGTDNSSDPLFSIDTKDTRLKNVDTILNYKVKYTIKNQYVPAITPFIFNFGKWPTFVRNYSLKEFHGTKVLGDSSFELYGKDKAILISSTQSPFIWNLSMDNGNVTLSTISTMGFQPKQTGNLDIVMKIYSIRGDVETIKIIRSEITQNYKVIPRIILNSNGNELSQITFRYKQDGKIIEKIIQENNEKLLVFDNEPIDIEGDEFYFPFDNYESLIFGVYPPALQTKNLTLNLNIESPFDGIAYFENDKISFQMKTNQKILLTFWISLSIFIITLIILLLKLKKEDLTKYAIIEAVLGLFLIYYGSLERWFSVGTLIFIAVAILLTILFYKKS